jgi:hypothetical protein
MKNDICKFICYRYYIQNILFKNVYKHNFVTKS